MVAALVKTRWQMLGEIWREGIRPDIEKLSFALGAILAMIFWTMSAGLLLSVPIAAGMNYLAFLAVEAGWPYAFLATILVIIIGLTLMAVSDMDGRGLSSQRPVWHGWFTGGIYAGGVYGCFGSSLFLLAWIIDLFR